MDGGGGETGGGGGMYCVNGENKARDGQKWASNNWAHARFAKSPVIKPREEIRSAEGHYRISGICVLLTDTSSSQRLPTTLPKRPLPSSHCLLGINKSAFCLSLSDAVAARQRRFLAVLAKKAHTRAVLFAGKCAIV